MTELITPTQAYVRRLKASRFTKLDEARAAVRAVAYATRWPAWDILQLCDGSYQIREVKIHESR